MSIKAAEMLLRNTAGELSELELEYKNCLYHLTVSEDFLIKTKNFLAANRSILDYIAHEVVQFCRERPTRVYFPIASKNVREEKFRGELKKWFPGLSLSHPKLFEYLCEIQHFREGNEWLTAFHNISNEYKHVTLTPMTIQGCKAVVIRNPNGTGLQIGDRGFQRVELEENSCMRFPDPSGRSLAVRGPQVIDLDTTSLLDADDDLEIIHQEWTEYKFEEFQNQPAIVFLRIVDREVRQIFHKLVILMDQPHLNS